MTNQIFYNYDTLIVGAGIGGLFAAYRLKQLDPRMKILIIDKGNELNKRMCPAAKGSSCVHCPICAITSGIAGSGAFSDAKFNIGTAYGGTLAEELGEDCSIRYITEVDKILEKFSEDYPAIYESNEELKLKCLQNNLRLLDMNVRHLGTDRNVVTMNKLVEHLRNSGVEIFSRTDCKWIVRADGCFKTTIDTNDGTEFSVKSIVSKYIIVATGRGGADFVERLCRDFNVETESNSVDIGVRVEMKDSIWREFSSKIYEPKILCKTTTFEDRTRMFCFNQGGIVSAENNRGIITANGHSFADPSKKTENCNFAILSSIHFTEPFNQPTEYAENISKLANMIGKGNVIVQRFGDLIRGRRTTEHRLSQNTVSPTLKATAGDLSLVLPHRILTNIIETVYALDKVAPGTANDDTLLYGCESKYYSLKPKHNNTFEISDNLYLIGDGSGITRGLSQAAAMGLYVAENILK
jgi:uncharacterized FAD-dependent dehydrogenase